MFEWNSIGLGLFSTTALAFILCHRPRNTLLEKPIVQSDGPSIFKREFASVSPRIASILASLTTSSLPASLSSSLQQPFLEMFNRGGKRIRPVLCALIGRICDCSQEEIDIVGATIESLHNASLIIDDIEDNSKMRRNAVCVHEKFGVNRAISSANYMYFRPFLGMYEKIENGKKRQILEIFLQEMTLSHLGQAEDLHCHHLPYHDVDRFSQELPDKPQYVRLVVSKTGSLLRMMVRWLCCLGEVQQQFNTYLVKSIENLAICFQIRDDLINIRSTMGKGVQGEDLLERKITLMVIQTVRMKDRKFVELFCKEDKTEQNVQELIRIIKDNGSQKAAERQCEVYGKGALKDLRKLPRSQARLDLQKVLEMIINRNQ